jgi:uncharacterized protein YkwD
MSPIRHAQLALIAASSVALLATPAASADRCAHARLRPDARNAATIRAAILCLVNEQRARQGERPLRPDSRLTRAAERHASEMVNGRYLSHLSPGGATPADRVKAAGYVPKGWGYTIGENIAYSEGRRMTPAELVAAWMRSPAHRANILAHNYRDSGIGVVVAAADGSAPTVTVTQDFAEVLAPIGG